MEKIIQIAVVVNQEVGESLYALTADGKVYERIFQKTEKIDNPYTGASWKGKYVWKEIQEIEEV